MSNHLAIAAVTAALRRQLQAALDTDLPPVPSAKVTAVRPNAPSGDLPSPGVNLFLYQVGPNLALRNADLPTRDRGGSFLQRPSEALNLHYLLSFYGDDKRLEPQRLLGSAVRALRAEAVLTRAALQSTLADPLYSYLVGSDLADAPEQLRITPTSLNLEELSKLWSVFFQTPYVLSVAYAVSVVSISNDVQPREALPVRRVRVQADAGLPLLEQLLSQTAPDARELSGASIHAGDTLVLVGRDLVGPVTRVRIGALEVVPAASALTAERISVPLPAALQAGAHSVRVLQRSTASPLERNSNALGFVLQPRISPALLGAALRVTFSPAVGRVQRVRLVLNQADAAPGGEARSYVFDVPPRDAPDMSPSLDIDIPGVAPGEYLVRVHVDEAVSDLTYDPIAGRYTGPSVVIP
ncbi:MAG TPA: DUF4255 domain-containing protein [Polyangiaceae bacterium]|nr:DUF4255 domain-containing protein [Polyangiaceae bacterium]